MKGPQAAQSTQAGVFRGKLCYGAPETIQGEPATPRSDQYSAAILLLELLTLETPFNSNTMAETVARMVNEAPPVPSRTRDP
jgi:serine/threonine-protein kinase